MTTRLPLWLLACLTFPGVVLAQAQYTNPSQYTSIEEITRRGGRAAVTAPNTEVDDQSIIRIAFNNNQMACTPTQRRVDILVTGSVRKGTTVTPIVPILPYVFNDASGKVVSQSAAYDPGPPNGPGPRSMVPNTSIDLQAAGAAGADDIVIRVVNLSNQETLEVHLTPRPFGFRTKTSDSFLLVKRLGVHSAEQALGFDRSNFSPAPGVTFGGVFTGRNSLGRFLQPGVGVNVSFISWSDPAIGKTTGQPTPGTSTSSVQVGTGAMFSFFSDVLQFTVGANLNADRHRGYWGVGFSFVNLAERLKGSK